jgi:DNA-directed RNA polymerase specialized sigma24 family protein
MRQEATIAAWQALDRYDESRPLPNFLWVHIRNSLYNLKRNEFARPTPPCESCPFKAYVKKKCTKFEDPVSCHLYKNWIDKNEKKKNLMSTKEAVDTAGFKTESIENTLINRELFAIVDEAIPSTLREDWVRFINGHKLTKVKRDTILATIKQIIEDRDISIEEYYD